MIKRGSSVDQVGLPCQSNVVASDVTTGQNFIVPENPAMPVQGYSEQPAQGCDTSCGGKNFKANTGNDNP